MDDAMHADRLPGVPRGPRDTLTAIGDHLSDGVYFATVAGVVTYANEVCLGWLGVDSPEDLAGFTIDELWADAASRDSSIEVDGRRRRLTRRDGPDLRICEYRVPQYDVQGDCIGYFGVLVREPRAGAGGETPRVQPRPDVLPVLDSNDPRRGCLVFDIETEDGKAAVHASRDLAHLIVRLTRPEDLVTECGERRVVLFAEVGSVAALKAIAERVAARGRREIDAGFRVGVAMRGESESPEATVGRAERATYVQKRRLRGRVPVARSGPNRAA
jgi:PAS domain-containing protein